MDKTYSEMLKFDSFEERAEYLKLDGELFGETFGSKRYANQRFYQSREWVTIRNKIIVRDNGCDLGIQSRPISGRIYVHHIKPITYDDVLNRSKLLTDPENLVCVTKSTHDYIHYGIQFKPSEALTERSMGDTKLW